MISSNTAWEERLYLITKKKERKKGTCARLGYFKKIRITPWVRIKMQQQDSWRFLSFLFCAIDMCINYQGLNGGGVSLSSPPGPSRKTTDEGGGEDTHTRTRTQIRFYLAPCGRGTRLPRSTSAPVPSPPFSTITLLIIKQSEGGFRGCTQQAAASMAVLSQHSAAVRLLLSLFHWDQGRKNWKRHGYPGGGVQNRLFSKRKS